MLYDSAGSPTITLDGSTGVISKAGLNGFLIRHPHDPSREIFYASLEGPEAGIYARGTGRLEGGRAVVRLPEHFTAVANPVGLTVQLTPSSADTYGLAVVEKSPTSIVVQELAGGVGNFAFDWVVHAARGDIPTIDPVRYRAVPRSEAKARQTRGPRRLEAKFKPLELREDDADTEAADEELNDTPEVGAPRDTELADAVDVQGVEDEDTASETLVGSANLQRPSSGNSVITPEPEVKP